MIAGVLIIVAVILACAAWKHEMQSRQSRPGYDLELWEDDDDE